MEQHIKRSAVPHIMFIYNMHIQLYKHLQTQADGCILCASLLMPIITQQYDSAGGKGVTLDYRRKSQFLFKDSLCSDTTTPLLFSRATIWRECTQLPILSWKFVTTILNGLQEVQRDIEKHSTGVASVLNLCEVLLHDCDACSTETGCDSIQQSTRGLERRWRNICAMSMERRLKSVTLTQLILRDCHHIHRLTVTCILFSII